MTQPPEFTEAELEDQEMFRFMVDAYHAFRAKKQIRLMVEFHFLEVMFNLTDQLAADAKRIENFTLETNLVLLEIPEYTRPEKLWTVKEQWIIDEFPVRELRRTIPPQEVPETATIPYNAVAKTTRYVRDTLAYLAAHYEAGIENKLARSQLPPEEHFDFNQPSTRTNPDIVHALNVKKIRKNCSATGIPIHQFDSKSASPQEGAA